MLHAYLNYNWLKNTDVTEIVSQLGSTDALFSASETRVKKVVCSRKLTALWLKRFVIIRI